MTSPSPNLPDRASPTVSRAGLRALVALQAITLVCVLASGRATPVAQAAVAAPPPTLPNAAEQRERQLAMLERISQQLADANAAAKADTSAATLASIDARLEKLTAAVERLERADRGDGKAGE